MVASGTNNDELIAMVLAYRQTGVEALHEALVEALMPVVHRVSRQIHHTLPPQIELEDLASVGVFGLMASIDGFDPSSGRELRSYCALRVRGAILDDLRRQDWMPRLVRREARRLQEVADRLTSTLGRSPSELELAEAMGLTETRLRELQRQATAAVQSLGVAGGEDGAGTTFLEPVDERSVDPVDVVGERELVTRFVDRLTDRERVIVRMLYEEGCSLSEIGEQLSLTRSRVSQIHTNLRSRISLRGGMSTS